MAGGFKKFGPTYKTTDIVRLGYEGYLNGTHHISEALVTEAVAAGDENVELAGKVAAVKEDGIGLAGEGGEGAVGLFREDINDMVNASFNASFYFRGGEYYVQIGRTAFESESDVKVGDKLTCDAEGKLKKAAGSGSETVIGIVTHVGKYPAGNMYEWADDATNGGTYVGFIMYI